MRLRKIGKKGARIKYTSLSKNKIKTTKSKSKMFIYANEKIELKKGESLKIKRNRKAKNQVADLEVITPE